MASPATPEKQSMKWRTISWLRSIARIQQREEQIFLLLSLLIGALTGLAVVAFIVLTERLGMLTREMLELAFVDGRREQPLKDLVETLQVPHLHTDHALHLALERMSKYHLDLLPVVHRADIHKLEGVVTLPDVLNAYGVDCPGSE